MTLAAHVFFGTIFLIVVGGFFVILLFMLLTENVFLGTLFMIPLGILLVILLG
jgi:hypothetical protein